MQNRSMRASTVKLRLTVGNHRIQLGFGDGAVVLTEFKGGEQIPTVARSPSWCVSKTLTHTMTVPRAMAPSS